MNRRETLEIPVRADTHPNSLAACIAGAWLDGKRIAVVAIGPVPVANAYKAVVAANRFLAPNGVCLSIIPGMEKRLIDDRESKGKVPWVVSVMTLFDIYEAGRDNANSAASERLREGSEKQARANEQEEGQVLRKVSG